MRSEERVRKTRRGREEGKTSGPFHCHHSSLLSGLISGGFLIPGDAVTNQTSHKEHKSLKLRRASTLNMGEVLGGGGSFKILNRRRRRERKTQRQVPSEKKKESSSKEEEGEDS